MFIAFRRTEGQITSLQIGTVPRLRKVQYSRAWCEQKGPDDPLPTEIETVSATQTTNTTAQDSLSKGSAYPAFTRIETVSIPQNPQIKKAVQPFTKWVISTSARSTYIAVQRERGQAKPPLRQFDESALVSVDAREVACQLSHGFFMGSQLVEHYQNV